MSCECQHTDNGLGALAAVYGLGVIKGQPVHRGAPFSYAVEFEDWYADVSWKPLVQVLSEIKAKLDQSGYVTGLTKIYQLAGYFDPFIVVEGFSGREYGSDLHLRDAITSVVTSIYGNIDYSTIKFEVETYNPQTNQPQTTRRDTSGGGATQAPQDSSSGFSLPSLEIDKLATSLGVTRTQAILIGAGGALLGLLLLRRLF